MLLPPFCRFALIWWQWRHSSPWSPSAPLQTSSLGREVEGGGRASERAGLGTARKSAQERRLILFFQSATAAARHARAESSSQIVELWHRSKEPNLKYKASLATITLIINHQSTYSMSWARLQPPWASTSENAAMPLPYLGAWDWRG